VPDLRGTREGNVLSFGRVWSKSPVVVSKRWAWRILMDWMRTLSGTRVGAPWKSGDAKSRCHGGNRWVNNPTEWGHSLRLTGIARDAGTCIFTTLAHYFS